MGSGPSRFFFDMNNSSSIYGVSCLDVSGTGCLLSGMFLDIAVETDYAASS